MNNAIRFFVLLLASYALLSLRSLGQQNEPSWPQQFQVLQGEPTSFGFAVTQPGPIVISITAQGQPITVTLKGPLLQPVQQSGSGSMVLNYSATAADVQKSALWVVELTAAGSTPASAHLPIGLAPMGATAPVAPGAVAGGNIAVQHPPANVPAVQAQIQQNASAIQLRLQQTARQPLSDTLTATKAAYTQQLASQQAAQKQLLLSQIAVKPIAPAARQGPMTPTGIVKMTTTTSSASTGIAPAGSTGVQTVAPPAISSLNVTHGQPGDPVLLTGIGFGSSTGEVHFIVNPGMDLVGTLVDSWSDTQILTYVPDASGILAFPGVVYVKSSAGQKSALVSFQFDPAIDYAQLIPSVDDPDAQINGTDLNRDMSRADHDISHWGDSDIWGHKADDTFYNTLTLKNGWVVDSVSVAPPYCGPGSCGVSVVDSRVGTGSPYSKVHWWMDAFSVAIYRPVVTIKGPKGVAYQ